MRIAILGAGFTGLSAAYYLEKYGHKVTVIEKKGIPGGLATGFKLKDWNWTIEKHYHHFFTNDNYAFEFAKEIGHTIIIKRPKTSVYIDNKIYQLDSPFELLKFPKLSLIEKIRMAAVLGFLKYNPFWKMFEKTKTTDFLSKKMGTKSYKMIWEPQLLAKFGNKYKDKISLVWFWARIRKRTAKLAYPEGGFLSFAEKACGKIYDLGGKIIFNTNVIEIEEKQNQILIKTKNKDGEEKLLNFDKIIITLPSFLFLKLIKKLPYSYKNKFINFESLGAVNLILRLKKPFFKDGTYWLSICDNSSPFTCIVEHTNFMDKKNYNKEHIVYIGKYLSPNHLYFSKNADELLKIYDSYLKKINANYKSSIINLELFKDPFAQPIIPENYSEIIPSFYTPFKNIYLANIQQVYPWDRGTNYAIELGEKIADIINNETR